MSSSFKTYVDITEHGSEDYEWVIQDENEPKLEPRLLPGEVLVASAANVLKFASVSNRKHGISGCLFVTNFKIAFISPTSFNHTGCPKDERNKILGPNEVCLANIDHIYQLNGERRKRLLPGTNIVNNVKTLQIVCKDFSVHCFSFKFCPVGFQKTLVNAILHHSFPKRVELLFTFECSLPATDTVHGMQFFTQPPDWESEVERCHCTEGWRVCVTNSSYQLSASLPQGFVVPRSLSDNQILKASKHFMGNRPPVWCWGHINKCVIVRMAVLYPFITDTQQESIMLEHVRKSHPNLREPLILELDKSMPSPADVQASWIKLRDTVCTPLDNIQKFWELDGRCYSLLNASRWPHHVMLCLRMANRVVEALSQHQVSVVLQESESRDMSAIVSCLAQLMMDPHFRTINGFQSLIQKEWISLGHAFTKRFGRISEHEAKQAPLFQLFLDCVWQMQHQLPTSFEFSETYLTSLWDSLHNTVFDTFSFDSDRVRHLSSAKPDDHQVDGDRPQFISRSVWDWAAQFHDVDIGLFLNPLFSVTCRVGAYRQRRGIPPTAVTPHRLLPRWIPSPPHQGADGQRVRRNSVSGGLTLPRGEYGAAESSGADSLGRSWGSRFGLAALGDAPPPSAGGSSRWKKIRGAFFHNSGRSFSPASHQVSAIDETMEIPPYADDSSVVTYRAARGTNEPAGGQVRWTVYGDHRRPNSNNEAVYDPIPSYPVHLEPSRISGSKPLRLELAWESEDIPYHELDWPVYASLPVADAFVDFDLWSQCYLRWIPVLDVRGGGQPPVYFGHCSVVNDILQLEHQLDKLQQLEGMTLEGDDSSPGQRFVTMNDHLASEPNGQVALSSFHPFVQQQNDSALSFGEWEIVPSPIVTASRPSVSSSSMQAVDYDDSELVTAVD